MRRTRRAFVASAGLAAGGMSAGCGEASRRAARLRLGAAPSDLRPTEAEARLLNRAGFGPSPGDTARLREMGAVAWVDQQLHPSSQEPPDLLLALSRLDALRLTPMELLDLPAGAVAGQLQQAALLRAAYSPWQLRERLTDFWTNHFSIDVRKADGAYLKPEDDAAVIRRFSLGRFRELLGASSRSAAMLTYLDNRDSDGRSPNENYARELLELHTLGVDGGYTQRDVREVARCFTGWTVESRFLRPRGRFRFRPDLHDDGPKVVLGVTIPAGGGLRDGERLLDLLADHPATARRIGAKLVRLVWGSEEPAWVRSTEHVYRQSGGHIGTMLRPMLVSARLADAPPVFKRPLDFVASALRATGAVADCGAAVQAHLQAMGQPLFEWPMPDGYPNTTEAWRGSLLARWNFAAALLRGEVSSASTLTATMARDFSRTNPRGAADVLASRILGRQPDARLVEIVARTAALGGAQAAIALLLASPEFQWR